MYGNSITLSAGYLFATLPDQFDASIYLAFLFGGSLIIAGACAINNVLDYKLDATMQRTKHRPTVTGEIGREKSALFGSWLTIVGLCVVATYAPLAALVILALGWIFYVVVYGFAKRVSVYGTHVGTISGSMPLLAGYIGGNGEVKTAVALFALFSFWQMAHFFAITLFRRKDYAAAGLPVMSVSKGARQTRSSIISYVVAYIIVAAYMLSTGLIGIIGGALLLTSAVWWLRVAVTKRSLSDEGYGRSVFGSSLQVMLFMSTALVLAPLFP